MQIDLTIDDAAQITIGEHAQYALLRIDHSSKAQALAGHFDKTRCQRGIWPHAGQFIAAAHDIGNMQQQLAAEAATRMRTGKIFGSEAACFEQGDSQCITHGQRGSGAGGRGQIVRTGFFGNADIEIDVGRLRQRGGAAASDGDDRQAQSLEVRQQHHHFGCFAGVGNGDDHVAARHHAQIAVRGFGRMEKERGCARAGQRGGDLAPYMTRLSQTGDDHTTGGAQT